MKTHEESDRALNAEPCLRRALSVFRSERDAQHQIRLFPRWKRKFIAKAVLNSEHGRTMKTTGKQPTHTSWWPSESLTPAKRADLFKTAREVQS